MDFLFYIFIVIAIIGVAVLHSLQSRNYPKGPIRFPLIGSYIAVRKLRNKLGFLHLVWDHLSKQYGEVFAVKVGKVEAVIVSGKDMVECVIDNDAFYSRQCRHVYRIRAFYESLVPIVDSSKWIEHGKLLELYFFVERIDFERVISYLQEEIGNLLLNIEEMSRGGIAIPVFGLFNVTMLNVYWKMISGYRFELNDPNLKKLMILIHDSFRVMNNAGELCRPVNQMPFISYKKLKHILDWFHAFLKESVEKHWVHPKNYLIRIILQEIEKLKRQEQSAEDYLLLTLLDLFVTGTEITGSTIGFAILELIKHPNVQARVYTELETIIGKRDVQITDQKKLPYLEAVLMEVQRFSNVVPLSIAYKTLQNTKLKEYTIPKGTMVMANIYSVHMDKNHWGDPEVFRPERFLNNATGKVVTDSWFIPFGVGRRKCPSNEFAKNSMFLIISRILQKYKIKAVPGVQLPEYPQEGITLSPSPFSVIFKPRPQ